MNVARLILDSIDRFGEFDAVSCGGREFTNLERLHWAERLAAVLIAHGVKPGDRVVVMMPNGAEVFSTFHAVWRIGAVIVPIAPQLIATEVRHILASSETTVALTCPALLKCVADAAAGLPHLRRLLVLGESNNYSAIDIDAEIAAAAPITTICDCRNDDLAMLLYTSGTTGTPKGVMLTHANLDANARATAAVFKMATRNVSMHVLPLSHSFGVLCMNVEAIHGCRQVILPRFEILPVLEAIQTHRVQRMAVVPTMLNYLTVCPDRVKYDCSSLEFVNCGAAALLEDVRQKFEAAFTCRVLPGYGLSETSPTVSALSEADWPRPGSVGRPIPDVQVVIRDAAGEPAPPGVEGEITVAGPGVMAGYWHDPDATQTAFIDGWLRTGDIGRLDADGFLYITDRLKDIILKGGENISPRSVEEVILTHPAVAECAVVGLPHPALGEEIYAVVVLRPGHPVIEAELIEHAVKNMSKFKVPAQIYFRPGLPKNAMGKVLKRELRKELVPRQ